MTKAEQTAVENRLHQARESLEEAKVLIVQDAEVNFVMNSLYYALLYPVFGLLQTKGMTPSTHDDAIARFEHAFVRTKAVDARFLDALRKAYELRPICACEGQKKPTHQDVEALLPIAEEFLELVGRMIE